MLIINADDWGGWQSATDAALACSQSRRLTSVTAMVFMADSERAAALSNSLGLDVGLHLNFNLPFTGICPPNTRRQHLRLCRWLGIHKYAQLLYNPFLSGAFCSVYEAQVQEFVRLYHRPPSHLDGHQHMHLCGNILYGRLIPDGLKVRRSFSFWPGEKNPVNRAYRRHLDRLMSRRHRSTHYFFSLSQCLRQERLGRVAELARSRHVELMAHPENREEYEWLMGPSCVELTKDLTMGTYAML